MLVYEMKSNNEIKFVMAFPPKHMPTYLKLLGLQLLSSAMKTDIGTVVRSSSKGSARRASMPLARQRSTISAKSQLSATLSAPPIVSL